MSEPRVRLCEASDTCADCGREIPSKVFTDEVNPIAAPLCTCKPWTNKTRPEGEP